MRMTNADLKRAYTALADEHARITVAFADYRLAVAAKDREITRLSKVLADNNLEISGYREQLRVYIGV